MLSVKDPALQLGQIKAMSDTDVIQLNAMYDCKSEYDLLCDALHPACVASGVSRK